MQVYNRLFQNQFTALMNHLFQGLILDLCAWRFDHKAGRKLKEAYTHVVAVC